MDNRFIQNFYDFTGQAAVVTGGAGVLLSPLCKALAQSNAKVAVLGLHEANAQSLAAEIQDSGGIAIGIGCDVLDRNSVKEASRQIVDVFGRIDLLINGAGGNKPAATTSDQSAFFDLPPDVLRWVFDLNLMGTILPCQIFGRLMADQKGGTVLNISSMNAFRPLTRIPAYSAAKAGVSNFTQWLAVHMAMEYAPSIRVNAIAPGFFLTKQNRFLLTEKDTGELTARGKSILDHTPMHRFGVPEDLIGTALWLLSPASAFVTGIVVPVDGGFSAYSGV